TAIPVYILCIVFSHTYCGRRQTMYQSGGQKLRLDDALSSDGRPSVVLLDEPTTGLDVSGRTALWDAIRQYHASGGTVLLTSHYLEEVQALAERVVVIDRGTVLADDSLQAVLSRVGMRRVQLTDAEGVRREHLVPDSDAFVRDLVTAGTPFRDLEIRGATLEEAFGELVGQGAEQAAGTTHAGVTTNEGALR